MVLRKLTENESDDLNHIIYDKVRIETLQILFGIIALDLNITNKNVEKLTYQYLCENYTGVEPKNGPFALWGIINTWIRETMIYKNIGTVESLAKTTKGLERNIYSAIIVIIYVVCHRDYGVSGKKQIEIADFYEKLDHELLSSKGFRLRQLPTETFQFIVSCLEYFGLARKMKKDRYITVDVSGITYSNLFDIF